MDGPFNQMDLGRDILTLLDELMEGPKLHAPGGGGPREALRGGIPGVFWGKGFVVGAIFEVFIAQVDSIP